MSQPYMEPKKKNEIIGYTYPIILKKRSGSYANL